MKIVWALVALSIGFPTCAIGKPASPTANGAEKFHKAEISLSPAEKAEEILQKLASQPSADRLVMPGSPGWREERNAVEHDRQAKQAKALRELLQLGSVIAPVMAKNLSSTNSQVQQICTESLITFGSAAIPAVIETLKVQGHIPAIDNILVQNGSDSLQPLMVLLRSANENERRLASAELLAVLSERYPGSFYRPTHHAIVYGMPAIQEICDKALNDPSSKVRDNLAQLLGRIGARGTVVAQTLEKMSTTETDPAVRCSAIAALGAIVSVEGKEAADKTARKLSELLAHDDYEGCRVEAATALGKAKESPDIAIPALVIGMKDGYPEVKEASVRSIGQFGQQAAIILPDLIATIKGNPDSTESIRALQTIGQLHEAATPALPLLAESLTSRNESVQRAALTAVNALGSVASPVVPQLVTALKSTNAMIRYNAERALQAMGPAALPAEPALRELLKSSQDRNHASNALRAITGKNPEEPTQPTQIPPMPMTAPETPHESI